MKIKKNEFSIYSFYRFLKVTKKKELKKRIDDFCKDKIIRGTILISDEGINATISGFESELFDVTKIIKRHLCIRKLDIKINKSKFLPFNRMKVRLKKEIISMGFDNLKFKQNSSSHLSPIEWDKYINKNNVTIIDTRNKYEIEIGKFKNSINPGTNSFREFPNKFKKMKIEKKEKILIYCTGGIRCEKASAYLKTNGYENVFQLKGGILNYLNFVKNKQLKSKWSGECFVFDNRVSVNKDLKKGKYIQCYGCRRPITTQDTKSSKYKKGVSCSYCYDERSNLQKKSSLSRQINIELDELRKKNHVFKKRLPTS
tara:strand:- start:169 stop:1110 length:942 start_codon:yes stop_codon:yes gene_type:complete